MKHSFKSKKRRGQAYVEYALLLALGAIGMVWIVNQATDRVEESSDEVACDIAYGGRVDCESVVDGDDGNDGLPIARFVFSCTDTVCSFDGTASSDSNGEIVKLDWTFADTGTDIGWTPDHTFPTPGQYAVTLKVTDNDGNTDDTTKIVTIEPGPECPPTPDIDGLPAGTVLFDQFEGMTISSHNQGRYPAMLFDSENPTGGDTDLGSPNADFGGPGHGSGGRAGQPGENSQPQGMVMIVSEDGDSNDPDDRASGGELIFEFEYDANVSTLAFLDVDDAPKNPTVKLYDRSGRMFWSNDVPPLGDNSYVLMEVDQTGVAKLVVDFPGSGSVDGLFFCEDYPTVDGDAPQVVEDNDVSENQPPMAAFSYTCEDATCQFDASGSNDPDGAITNIAWDYGDGQRGNAEAVTHTFATSGTYNVTLTVTDNDGATQSTTKSITVTAPDAPEDVPPAFQCEGSPTISSFEIVNTGNGSVIRPLVNGDTIDFSDLGTKNISVIAIASNGTPRSVVFELNGSEVQTENGAPYAIEGDASGNYRTWNVQNGSYTLRATVFSDRNGNGEERGCLEVEFTVQD